MRVVQGARRNFIEAYFLYVEIKFTEVQRRNAPFVRVHLGASLELERPQEKSHQDK
jgi:hypothetical protein